MKLFSRNPALIKTLGSENFYAENELNDSITCFLIEGAGDNGHNGHIHAHYIYSALLSGHLEKDLIEVCKRRANMLRVHKRNLSNEVKRREEIARQRWRDLPSFKQDDEL